MRRLALVLALAAGPAVSAQSWTSEIVTVRDDGRLGYVSDSEGNRVPDFADAGYARGERALPDVPTVVTVSPVSGDDTASIQAAIDAVEARDADADGRRGAVELAAGVYEVNGTLEIRESGVVLRGAGDDADPSANTILRRSGANQDPVICAGRCEAALGDALVGRASGPVTTIATDVLPVGTRTFEVDSADNLAEGDAVVLYHAATLAWINAVDRGATAGDSPWTVGELPIAFARTVERIEGTTVTLDAPTFYRLDASISPFYLYPRGTGNVLREIGVESLRIDIETQSPTDETQARDALVLALVENAWVDDVTALHFWHAGVSVQHSRYVTVQNSRAIDPHSVVDGGRRYNFEVERSQLVLFQGNYANDARHAYVGNGTTYDSGIVFLDNTSEDASTSSEAHRRWGMGFLFDNHIELGSRGTGTSDRRIHLGNRGSFGTGHGWACANCVVWNATMNGALVIVEKPPTAQNYAIGVEGTVSRQGPFLSTTTPYIEGTNEAGLEPASLYLGQRLDRELPVATVDEDLGALRLQPPAPNPTAGPTRLRFDLATPGEVRLSVLDTLGREVAVAASGRFAAGPHLAVLDAGQLPPGVYLARLTTDAAARTTRFTVVR